MYNVKSTSKYIVHPTFYFNTKKTKEMDLEKFVEYVHAENKVEPKDVMPDDYRKLLVRQISQHAHSELWECFLKPTGFQEHLH